MKMDARLSRHCRGLRFPARGASLLWEMFASFAWHRILLRSKNLLGEKTTSLCQVRFCLLTDLYPATMGSAMLCSYGYAQQALQNLWTCNDSMATNYFDLPVRLEVLQQFPPNGIQLDDFHHERSQARSFWCHQFADHDFEKSRHGSHTTNHHDPCAIHVPGQPFDVQIGASRLQSQVAWVTV